MNLEELINMLDDEILSGWSLPLTNGRCILDREKIKDIIQDIRLNLPSEIKQAKAIVADKNEILEHAEKEAADIIAKAQEKALQLASQEEVLKVANQKAAEATAAAQGRSREIKQNTVAYTENLLEQMEELLTKSLLEVKQTRQQIKNVSK